MEACFERKDQIRLFYGPLEGGRRRATVKISRGLIDIVPAIGRTPHDRVAAHNRHQQRRVLDIGLDAFATPQGRSTSLSSLLIGCAFLAFPMI